MSYFWISIAPEHFCATVVFDDPSQINVYEGLDARTCIWRLKCSKMYMKAQMLGNEYEGLNVKNVYEGLNAGSEVYLSKVYFCEMYPTCDLRVF